MSHSKLERRDVETLLQNNIAKHHHQDSSPGIKAAVRRECRRLQVFLQLIFNARPADEPEMFDLLLSDASFEMLLKR
jgi:hypothetical protein